MSAALTDAGARVLPVRIDAGRIEDRTELSREDRLNPLSTKSSSSTTAATKATIQRDVKRAIDAPEVDGERGRAAESRGLHGRVIADEIRMGSQGLTPAMGEWASVGMSEYVGEW